MSYSAGGKPRERDTPSTNPFAVPVSLEKVTPEFAFRALPTGPRMGLVEGFTMLMMQQMIKYRGAMLIPDEHDAFHWWFGKIVTDGWFGGFQDTLEKAKREVDARIALMRSPRGDYADEVTQEKIEQERNQFFAGSFLKPMNRPRLIPRLCSGPSVTVRG